MDLKNVRWVSAIPQPPPSHFTLNEWYLNNRNRYRTAKDQQHIADRVMAESDRLRDFTSDVTELNKAEVDKRLEEKIIDTEYWKKENEIHKEECCKEEEALLVYKERLMDILEYLKEQALEMCKKCIILR
jgi:tektin-1